MERKDIYLKKIPDSPGIYIFRGSKREVLYIGKAGSLRERVKSYFSNRLISDRGERLVEAVEKAKSVETIKTDSVLDALLLEVNLIKKFNPKFNAREKDNKSFPFIVITDEDFPRVLQIRGRELEKGNLSFKRKYIFGPFPKGSSLKEAMRIIRKHFPFRDKCMPGKGVECFEAQLGLCPGVCSGLFSKSEYRKRIRELKLFFEGKKYKILKDLDTDMKKFAKKEEFEKAEEVRKRIFALTHIRDANLIKRGFTEGLNENFRTEAYDIAHISGKDTVGVMVVVEDGEINKSEYRVFTIKNSVKGSDTDALKEVLSRRFNHPEWRFPNLIVVDGGTQQLNTAKKEINKYNINIPVVSVKKGLGHKAVSVLGDKSYIYTKEEEILLSNEESHRFAISKHRAKRQKGMFGVKIKK